MSWYPECPNCQKGKLFEKEGGKEAYCAECGFTEPIYRWDPEPDPLDQGDNIYHDVDEDPYFDDWNDYYGYTHSSYDDEDFND